MLHYQETDIKVEHYSDFNNIEYNAPIFVLFPDDPSPQLWHKLPHGDILYKRWQSQQEACKNLSNNKAYSLTSFYSQLPNEQGTNICIINLKTADTRFKILELLRKQIEKLCCNKATTNSINLLLYSFNTESEEKIINDFIICAGSFYTVLPKISKKNDNITNLKLTLYCHGTNPSANSYNHHKALAEVKGNGLARFLCNLPANYLYPTTYREYIQALAKTKGWQYEFIDQEALKKKQAGAYLAVIQGSARQDAGIIHLTYTPKAAKNPPTKKIALVGKGMCFDTGGHNLKTHPGSMYGMGHDMTGSAIALSTLFALSELQVPFQVDAWLALAQNDIGPHAYKPGDVVFASNGTSIEVINTDAEGRMVLADTLYLASKDEPHVVIDYATLTGTCVRALDEFYSGLVTNQYHWNSALMDIGQQCGERVWPFPFTEEYDEVLKSDIADIKQCHEGSADQIRAARFLGKFIHNKTPWIHIDLSAHAHKGGLGHIHTETTGFGVRFTLSLLLDHNLII
jgi:leucyl aminopeptidase